MRPPPARLLGYSDVLVQTLVAYYFAHRVYTRILGTELPQKLLDQRLVLVQV